MKKRNHNLKLVKSLKGGGRGVGGRNGRKLRVDGSEVAKGKSRMAEKPGGANGGTENGGGTIESKGAIGEERPELGSYRRNGNVAQLPKVVRDKINVMIRDGVSYREIIERLGEEGKGLHISNLSRWKDGGYKDWELEQAFIAGIRGRQESPGELARSFDATEVSHAALQLGTLHMFEALKELGPGSLNKKLGGDCAAFARLINALARASRETMLVQKYRDACAKARAAMQPLKDPKRKLTDEERRAIVLEVDDLLGLGSPEEAADVERGSVGVHELAVDGGGGEAKAVEEKDGRDEKDQRDQRREDGNLGLPTEAAETGKGENGPRDGTNGTEGTKGTNMNAL